MSKTRWPVLLIVCVALTFVVEAQKPQALPGRVPMHSLLLTPDAEWNAYYDVVPEDQRRLYYTVAKGLLPAARETVKNMQDLDKRVKALEAKMQPAEPKNPADPNKAPDAAK